MTRKKALEELMAKVEAGYGLDERVAMLATGRGDLVWKAFHGSLDAALALHEAVLPRWTFVIGPAAVHLWRNEDYGDPFCAPYEGKADTPARAWLLAILKALHAQEGEE